MHPTLRPEMMLRGNHKSHRESDQPLLLLGELRAGDARRRTVRWRGRDADGHPGDLMNRYASEGHKHMVDRHD
jgi:hypothetical protein